MKLNRISSVLVAGVLFAIFATASVNAQNGYSRDANQPVDQEYTKKIAEYTTEKFFNSPLTDYLPASPNVPTPQAVIGDVAGAPGKLPYAEDVYKYMRILEKATPRVKVFSIGTTEEGREMIAVAVASEALMAKLDANKADLAKLADPRTIQVNDALADDIAYVRNIREHVITLMTPIVEVDGRDRVVDIYKWRKAHPGKTAPAAIYW